MLKRSHHRHTRVRPSIDLIFVAEMRDFFHIVSPRIKRASERDITDDNNVIE